MAGAVLLHLALCSVVASADQQCEYGYVCTALPDATVVGGTGGFTTEIVYRSDGSSTNIRPGGTAPGVQYEYQLAPACGGNVSPGAGGDTACNAAFTCPDPNDYRYFVFYREISPNPIGWMRAGDQCLSATPTTPSAPVNVDPVVEQYLETLLVGQPQILFQPVSGGVVNVPVLFRTNAGPVSGTTSAFGLSVTVTAVPHYRWEFGDGAPFATDDPGRSYDGVDPRTNPEHYVSHTYGSAGARTVRLTVTWTATYTRSDSGEIYAASGTVVRQTSRPIMVKEYEAVVTF